MSEISDKVKALIAEKLGRELSEVTEQASFTNDLGADSLDIADLSMELEKEFHFENNSGEEPEINTVGEAIAYVEKKLAEK
ncbi:MAG: acyl carrier protein [Bacteroidales bacterium]|nr:acyl carrier protein [Bacteroidales bacterium]